MSSDLLETFCLFFAGDDCDFQSLLYRYKGPRILVRLAADDQDIEINRLACLALWGRDGHFRLHRVAADNRKLGGSNRFGED